MGRGSSPPSVGAPPDRAAAAGPRVTFLTNIPNPYNGYLYRELRQQGADVAVRYKGLPASEGRPWEIKPDAPDGVASHLWDERDAFAVGGASHPRTLVLAGSWATPRDALRRLAALRVHRPGGRVLLWGEAMSGRRGVRGVARRLYHAPVGLDAVLAIGTAAIEPYRRATGGRVPVHVLPYTTASGLDVERRRSPRPLVGLTGRLIPYKGVEVALRALAAMDPAERPALEVAGSGPLGPSLAELARTLGVEATFLGEVEPAELAERRSRWWLCLVPSQELEGWGLVVPEALNGGVPVVASGFVGAATDLVRDGLDGAVVARGDAADPGAWAAAIARVLEDDSHGGSEAVRRVGAAFAPHEAATWLRSLLSGDLAVERSFIVDGWARLGEVAGAPGTSSTAPPVDRSS